MTRTRNQAGAHRPAPPYPLIDPNVVYPIRRLADWGFGARTVAAMQQNGLRIMRYSKWRFVSGRALIEFLERATPEDSPQRRHKDQDGTRPAVWPPVPSSN